MCFAGGLIFVARRCLMFGAFCWLCQGAFLGCSTTFLQCETTSHRSQLWGIWTCSEGLEQTVYRCSITVSLHSFFFFLRCCGRLGSWVREVLTMQLFHQANYTAIRSINGTFYHSFFLDGQDPVSLCTARNRNRFWATISESRSWRSRTAWHSKLVLVRWDGKAHFHAISIIIIVIISVPWNRMTPRRWSDGFDFLPLVFHPQHQPFSSVAFVNNHVNVQKFFNFQGQRLVCIQFRVRLAISWEQTMM